MSGVLANIAAFEFDIELKKIADEHSGLYRRYSDDFILVIPKHQLTTTIRLTNFLKIVDNIRTLARENGIELQEEKTSISLSTFSKILDLQNKPSYLDYLGFIFDGKTVRMRSKSSYKFYRNAYNLIEHAQKMKKKKGLKELPYRKRIYRTYTDLGSISAPHGNFITYAKNAQKDFDKISPNTDNMMMIQIRNRKRKVEDRLGVRIHPSLKL